MKGLAVQEHRFVRQPISIDQIPWNQEWVSPDTSTRVVLRFHRRAKHLAEEWFDVEALVAEKVQEEGKEPEERYVVSVDYPEDRWLYGFILSFGQDVEVLEPEHIRGKIKEIARNIGNIYDPLQ
jgi:predicted DNA-binding transcriptional regulator YafY